MELYNVENHLFYDGYDLDNKDLSNTEYISNVTNLINEYIFNNKGNTTILPYFNGKVEEDGGISAIILGDYFHFTCHTFSYKNTVFIDYFGDESKKGLVKEIILDSFKTDNYDMGSKDIKGNFGKHIIIKPKSLSFDEAIKMIKLTLKEINMTPITDTLINKKDNLHFDLLQPIAESHISFHRKKDSMVVDAFSCKDFDVKKFLELYNNPSDYIEVNRGLQYKKILKG